MFYLWRNFKMLVFWQVELLTCSKMTTSAFGRRIGYWKKFCNDFKTNPWRILDLIKLNRIEMHFVNLQLSNTENIRTRMMTISEKETQTDRNWRQNVKRLISGRQALDSK